AGSSSAIATCRVAAARAFRCGRSSAARAILHGMTIAPRARGGLLAACTALAALAACFSDRGVAIEVDVGATGATSVELFLGKAAWHPGDKLAGIASTTIAPPDGTNPLDGNIWFRDAPAPYIVDVAGHTATFQLRADTPTTLPIVIAVGFVAEPTATGT